MFDIQFDQTPSELDLWVDDTAETLAAHTGLSTVATITTTTTIGGTAACF